MSEWPEVGPEPGVVGRGPGWDQEVWLTTCESCWMAPLPLPSSLSFWRVMANRLDWGTGECRALTTPPCCLKPSPKSPICLWLRGKGCQPSLCDRPDSHSFPSQSLLPLCLPTAPCHSTTLACLWFPHASGPFLSLSPLSSLTSSPFS